MIDEVQTGGGPTGKMWAFEHFDLPEAPDIVSFRYSKVRQLLSLNLVTEHRFKHLPWSNAFWSTDVAG